MKHAIQALQAGNLPKMRRTLYLVCYDIADSKRLRKVHQLIKSYAIGGQKSFYECWLTSKDLLVLKRVITQQIDLAVDRVHIFQLDSQSKPIFMGLANRQSIKPFLIV